MSEHVMTGPRSFGEMALKVAVDNIRLIKDLSGLAPRYLRIILNAVKSPAQLHELELNSDDIYDETEKHWQRFIAKDFRALSTVHKYAPNNRKSWHKVYEQYKKLQKEQIAAATEKMMQDFAARDEAKNSRSSKIISCEKSKNLRPTKAKRGFAPPREKASFFQQTKQQVRLEASRFNLRTPTGQLAVPAGQITKAPKSKLEEVRIASQPSMLQASAIRPARTRTADDRDREQKEARLRRLKNPRTPATGRLLVFTDDEDESGVDNLSDDPEPNEDDLFGDLQPRNTVISVSLKAPPKPMPLPVIERPAKRRRDTEEEATEQPAKRHRSTEEAAPEQAAKRHRVMPTTTTSASPQDRTPSHSPPSASNKPPATKLRPTTLSAAPSTNGVLRVHKPAPPPANKPHPTTINPMVYSTCPGTNGALRIRKPAPRPVNNKPPPTTPRPTILSAVPGTNGALRMRKPNPPKAKTGKRSTNIFASRR